MSDVWTLQAGGTTQSLAAWGIRNAHLTFRSLDVDELTFNIPTADIYGADLFSYGETLTLFKNSVRWFTGTVSKTPASGSPGTEQHGYIVSGPWWLLQRIIYQQYALMQNATFSCLTSQLTTRVTLGQDQWGNLISANQQIFNISVYALYKGTNFFALSTIPSLTNFPLEECRDITCAEAIKRCLRWTPDATTWFDYSGALPLLLVSQRPYSGLIVLDLAQKNLIESFDGITPRYDLRPPGVEFDYITALTNPATGQLYNQVTRDIAGAGSSQIGCIVATFDLTQGGGGGSPQTAPVGLAGKFWASLYTYLYWEGSIRLHESECGGLLRPGRSLNLIGGNSAWANMQTPIQVVTEDLDHGVTEATFGAPEHLGPQDFFALEAYFRNKPTPSAWASAQHNGTAGITYCPTGCDAGTYAAAVAAAAAAAADPTNPTLAIAALTAAVAAGSCGVVPQPNVPSVPNKAGPGSTTVAGQTPGQTNNNQNSGNSSYASFIELTYCDDNGQEHTVTVLGMP
jgi:hypothetical protein